MIAKIKRKHRVKKIDSKELCSFVTALSVPCEDAALAPWTPAGVAWMGYKPQPGEGPWHGGTGTTLTHVLRRHKWSGGVLTAR